MSYRDITLNLPKLSRFLAFCTTCWYKNARRCLANIIIFMNHKILEKFILTEDEQKFLQESHTSDTAPINSSRIISNLYLAKTIEESVDKTIQSNEKLADSNNKYARGMLLLTGGLIFVGLADIFVQIFLKFCK